MSLPFFYIEDYSSPSKEIVLNEDNSKHIVQVLRMKEGEKLNLTDGKGNLITAEISDAHKKHCKVKVEGARDKAQGTRKTSIAISLLKNASRFEWFLEKATEIGVSEIIPIICERTEKEKFRFDRMNSILISAMLQSQQCWLPVLHEPVQFADLIMSGFDDYKKFIAHCETSNKQNLQKVLPVGEDLGGASIILIGPEGDFTKEEIEVAMQNGFNPVSLGDTRLRSETAGIVAATWLCNA